MDSGIKCMMTCDKIIRGLRAFMNGAFYLKESGFKDIIFYKILLILKI